MTTKRNLARYCCDLACSHELKLAGLDGFVVGLPVTSRGNIHEVWTDSVQVLLICS